MIEDGLDSTRGWVGSNGIGETQKDPDHLENNARDSRWSRVFLFLSRISMEIFQEGEPSEYSNINIQLGDVCIVPGHHGR